MLINKILIVLVTVSSCFAKPEPEPKPEPDADFNMNFHFHDGGAGSGEDGSHEDMTCGHDSEGMCVMRQPYWGDCPSSMHYNPGICHDHHMICCKENPICGNDAQGQCYRKDADTEECPLPLFRQSTRRSPPCPDHGTSCCADLPDPHCNCGHWGYVGMCGERGWTGLCEDFCADDRQSPINIETDVAMPLPMLPFNMTGYNKVFANIECENNGHFAVCHFNSASIKPKISGGGLQGEYYFDHMEFHIGCHDGEGSEHTIDGISYSGELHLIHFSTNYANYSMALHSGDPRAVAVVAVFLAVNETQHNDVYEPFMENLVYIDKRYEDKTFSFNHPLEAFLPKNCYPFYRYEGSLTYPSCNEVVVWSVIQEPATIGMYQIRPFRAMMEGHGDHMCDNHRPTQPLNGRKVYKCE